MGSGFEDQPDHPSPLEPVLLERSRRALYRKPKPSGPPPSGWMLNRNGQRSHPAPPSPWRRHGVGLRQTRYASGHRVFHPPCTTLRSPLDPTHLAVLDDEPEITRLLTGYLTGHGFRVTPLHTGRDLMRLMEADAPALVLLDLGLPGEDGFAIARQLREHWQCGLVIVTGRCDAVDKVVGLEVGADDYVTKPFDLRELVARIKAVLRRITPAAPPAPA